MIAGRITGAGELKIPKVKESCHQNEGRIHYNGRAIHIGSHDHTVDIICDIAIRHQIVSHDGME